MPDTRAARHVARRSRLGAAARRLAQPKPMLDAYMARSLRIGALAIVFVLATPAAHAVTGAFNPAVGSPQQTAPAGRAVPVERVDRSTGTTASGPVRAEPPRMPFYVATKGQTTLYLLGTLHVGYAADYPTGQPFRQPILAALDASPVLALEISPDDMIVSQDDVTRYGMCRNPCLEQMLPDALYKKLVMRMRGNQVGLDEIRRTRPWLASMLVETYDTLNAGFQTEYGSEAQLQNAYLRAHGRIVGLESLGEQMATFTHLSLAEQREMLAQDLVQTAGENVADVRELYRLWRIGDADALKAWDDARTEKLARSKGVAARVDNRVVYDRNYRFVARMIALGGPNRPVFVAIGALHLGGRRGVLALLRRRGFVVEAA
jgi:uncharacterized protein YbaP (TraB family)